MAYRTATGPNGEKVIFRSATNDAGDIQWIAQPQLDKIPGSTSRSGQQRTQNRRDVETLRGRSPAERIQAKNVDEMGFLDQALVSGGREVDKLLAGVGDIKDFGLNAMDQGSEAVNNSLNVLPSAMKAVGGGIEQLLTGETEFADQFDPTTSMDRSVARRGEQRGKDEAYKIFQEEVNPVAEIAGQMLPYMVTGHLAGPTARTGAAAIQSGAQRAGTEAVKGSGRLRSIIQRQAAKGNQLAKEVDSDIIEPIAKKLQRQGVKPKIADPYNKGTMNEIIASAGIGAGEGTVHYDDNPIQGAIGSMVGTVAGKTPIHRVLERAPDANSKANREVLDWAKSKGFRVLPGMDVNSKKMQRFESALRSDDKFSDVMAQVDDANQEVITRIAGETAGIPPTAMKDITPEVLGKHMQDLSAQYQDLEAKSVGRLNRADIDRMSDHLQQFSKLKSKAGKENYAVVKDYFDQFRNMSKMGRDRRGRMTKATFNGTDYQKLRSRIKSAADDAYGQENSQLSAALRDMVKSLDNGIERGIKDFGGEASAQQWKDLNERYAMSNLLMESGMTPTGGVDMNKLTSKLMGSDAKRTLLEDGGAIKDLQKLVKLNYIQSKQAGSDLSGTMMGAHQQGAQSENQAFLRTPWSMRVPLLSRARAAAYRSGYPSKTGLLNLKPGQSSQLTRAAEQGGGLYTEDIAGGIGDGYNSLQELLRELGVME